MAKTIKTNEEIIKSLKKANKVNREKMAARAGFKSSEQYIQFLEGNGIKAPTKVEPIQKANVKPTIHIVDVLDASGSMDAQSKYIVATKGILAGLGDLSTNKDVNFTYTLTEFVNSSNIINPFFLSKNIPVFIPFHGPTGYNTPLYKTVYDLLTKLAQTVKPTDKVLVKVYTDGIDNATTGFRKSLAGLIKELNSKNFTITVVAAGKDLDRITSDLNLDGSNTLSVTNDRKGFEKAFKESRGATMMFASKVSKGEDVLKGFYKKTGTL